MPNQKTPDNVLTEYQRWKEAGEELRAQARQAMETRFRDLLTEAAQLAQEFRQDFGAVLKPPPAVTAFRYKTGAKPKAKKTAPKAKPEPEPPAKPDRKTLGLQKRLETAKKKLEAAKSGGGPTKNLEDKVYEIEDELRLSQQ